MKYLDFHGHQLSQMGIGTWYVGEGDKERSKAEIESIRYGLNHGINIIDTAEMYGSGKSETLIGQALKGFDRSQIYLISKFYPQNATPKRMRHSLKNSLRRLQTDYLDLYLLHWRGGVPLAETVVGLQQLQTEGLIKAWGVSNFDVSDLEELEQVDGGNHIIANEDLYNLQSRGVEYDVLPWQKAHDINFIGYSPFGSGSGKSIPITDNLKLVADKHHATVHQVLLAWVIRSGHVLSIPKASHVAHMKENIAAMDIDLTSEDLALLDQDFPAPTSKQSLEMI